jgi:hypothetical protein
VFEEVSGWTIPGRGRGLRESQLSSTENVSCSLTMTDRSITFCNSRILPGQAYDCSRSRLFLSTAVKCLPRFPCVAIQEVRDKQGNVFFSFPQAAALNGKDVQPVKQVAAELPARSRTPGRDWWRRSPAHRPEWIRFLRCAQIRVPAEPAKERPEFRPGVLQLRRGRSCLSLPVQSVLNDAALLP